MQSNTSGQISLKNTNRYKAMRLPTPSCFKIDTRFNASDLKHYQTDYYEIERRIEIVCMYEIEIPRQIGQSIKSKRLKKGFTQEQLTKLSNTSRSLVYRLEKGTRMSHQWLIRQQRSCIRQIVTISGQQSKRSKIRVFHTLPRTKGK